MNTKDGELDLPKGDWGPGPWQDEPDRVEWEHNGFPCLMRRNMQVTGSWCGYVAVPEEHPAFEKGYGYLDVSAHGGLTYSDHCDGEVCHTPKPGASDNVWWLGFDCAHAGDLSPKMEVLTGRMGFPDLSWQRYRDLDWVKKEVEHLADQLAAMK